MRALLDAIRRRKLLQWTAAYLGSAWLVLEVVDTLGSLWAWPALVGRVVFVVVTAGFFGALVVGWHHGAGGRQRITLLEVVLLSGITLAGGAVAVFVAGRGTGAATSASVSSSGSGTATSPDPRSLVVLPFVDLSPQGDRGYLGDGITETLINSLARVPGVRVVARTSAFQFKDKDMDAATIAAQLGVGSVLEGTVTQVGERVRVTADLLDGRSGVARWAERFDREMRAADLFALQDDVARRIVEALRAQLGSDEPVVRGGSRIQDAQKAYYLGLHHWTLRTTQDMALAARYFDEAIAADSSYADAWAGLALTYILWVPSEYNVPGISASEALERAENAAHVAIRLDSASAAAYTALGDLHRQRGQLDQAEASFRRALALNPGYATAHHWLADLFMLSLKGDDALREIQVAATLDPLAPAILGEKVEAFMMLGRYPEARAAMDDAIQRLPGSPLLRGWFAAFLVTMGEWDRAAEQLGGLFELEGRPPGSGQRLVRDLRNADRRDALLRLIADGRFQEAGFPGRLDPSQAIIFQLVATRSVHGGEAALDLLTRERDGPNVAALYLPLLPALMGPDVSAQPRFRQLMETLVRAQAVTTEG